MEDKKNNILKEHQKPAYENVLNLFNEQGKAAVVLPTGCGKTFIALQYMLDHPDAKVLFLSPRHLINHQMYEYVIKYLGGDERDIDEIMVEFNTLEAAVKKYAPNFKAMLYQSMGALNEKEMFDKACDKLKPDLIIVDEMHHLELKREDEEEYLSENVWGQKFNDFLKRNPNAKVLGLTATPIKMNGANILERMFVDSVAEELTLLEALEAGIIHPPKYVVPDFITEEEKQSLLTRIENSQGDKKQELKAKYDELVEKSDRAPGIPQLMKEHITEKDGRYIVFCKDIKDIEEKMQQAKEWFKEIDDEPEIFGIHSANSRKYNDQQKDEFGKSKSEHIKIMFAAKMLDEGVHIKDISGVIITAKTESRPSYLQRIGRVISSDDKRKETLVIDLVNNNEILQNEITEADRGYELKDVEALAQLVDWIEDKNDGKMPVLSDENGFKENLMAKRFIRLNNKYYKYVENEELFNQLDEEKQAEVDEIIMLGDQIGLWDEYIEIDDLDVLEDINRMNKFIDDFEIKGVRREFIDLISMKLNNSHLENALEIKEWCEANFGDKEPWERRLPGRRKESSTEEEDLANKLHNIRINTLSKYDGIQIDKIENKDDRKIVEIIRRLDEEYGLSGFLKNALEIENWCRKEFEDKEMWERRLPSKGEEFSEEEKKLAENLSILRTFCSKYNEIKTDEIKNQEHRTIVKIIRRLDEEYGLSKSLKNVLEIENWCRKEFEDREMWERRLPSRGKKFSVEENELGKNLHNIKTRFLNKYEGKKIDEIENKDDRRIVEIVRRLDEEYGLSGFLKNALEIENWCRKEFEDKEMWERRLPGRRKESSAEEKVLAKKLSSIRENILSKYDGIQIDKIENKDDRKIVEIIRRLDEEYNPQKYKTATNIGKTVASDISKEQIDAGADFLESIVHTKEKENEGVDYNE